MRPWTPRYFRLAWEHARRPVDEYGGTHGPRGTLDAPLEGVRFVARRAHRRHVVVRGAPRPQHARHPRHRVHFPRRAAARARVAREAGVVRGKDAKVVKIETVAPTVYNMRMYRETQRKGDAAVAQAIATFTKMGHDVSIPLTESAAYDLVIDFNEKLK